jgi:homoserine O-acetyltransferase
LKVLDERGISHLDHAIGCSYGGMVALALGEIAPERVGHIVAIGAAHRPHPLATAWRWIQRRVATLGDPQEGLALARALAMTTYRSDRELDARFAGRPEALEAWLEHHGAVFTRRFTEDEFIALSSAIDRHDVRPEAITTPTTVVGFDSDLLAPPWLLEELTERLPSAAYVKLSSLYGHDAFLKEIDALAEVLRGVLQAEIEVAA